MPRIYEFLMKIEPNLMKIKSSYIFLGTTTRILLYSSNLERPAKINSFLSG